MKKKTKVWIGVGAFVLAGGSAIPASADTALDRALAKPNTSNIRYTPPSQIRLAQSGERGGHKGHGERGSKGGAAGEAGEAGEAGGEKGAATLPADLAFARSIALIRGHLLIGNELVKQGEWTAAFPHFLHPVEELYGDIRKSLKKYKTPPFESALKNLANTVKTKNAKQYDAALRKVEAALAKSDAGLKSKRRDWQRFTLAVALEALKTSASEYKEAIVDNSIAKPVEYQDARGFIWHAEKMIESIAGGLQRKDATSLRHIREGLAELKHVFPAAMPPKSPVKDAGSVLGIVSKIELAANNLL